MQQSQNTHLHINIKVNSRSDQHDDRQEEIDNLRLFDRRSRALTITDINFIRSWRSKNPPLFPSTLFSFCHWSKYWNNSHNDQRNYQSSNPAINIIWNRLDKKLQPPSPSAAAPDCSSRLAIYTAQVEIGINTHTGAAVESTI